MDGLHGVKRSIEAKNLLRYGFLDINFGLSNNYEAVKDIKDLHYYQHHPPLNSILIAVVFSIFGVSEISARILPILFTTCSIILVYNIAKYVGGRHVALMSAFIFSIMPSTTYWGNTPSYQPLTLFFILLTMVLYINWTNNSSTGKFLLMLFVYSISLMCDWPAYFLGLLLPIHMIIADKKIFPLRKEVVLIPILTVCIFSLFLYYVYIVQPEEITSLFTQLKIYLSIVDKPVETIQTTHGGEFLDFTMKQFFAKNLRFATLLFTYGDRQDPDSPGFTLSGFPV
jgi:4-amino-4-deoxy-L-arabinose transferase-like glycosyltransferase